MNILEKRQIYAVFNLEKWRKHSFIRYKNKNSILFPKRDVLRMFAHKDARHVSCLIPSGFTRHII